MSLRPAALPLRTLLTCRRFVEFAGAGQAASTRAAGRAVAGRRGLCICCIPARFLSSPRWHRVVARPKALLRESDPPSVANPSYDLLCLPSQRDAQSLHSLFSGCSEPNDYVKRIEAEVERLRGKNARSGCRAVRLLVWRHVTDCSCCKATIAVTRAEIAVLVRHGVPPPCHGAWISPYRLPCSTNVEAVRGTLYVAAIKLQSTIDSSRKLWQAHEQWASGSPPATPSTPDVSATSPLNAMLFALCRAGQLDVALSLAAQRVRSDHTAPPCCHVCNHPATVVRHVEHCCTSHRWM
jgi:hypothetical protein